MPQPQAPDEVNTEERVRILESNVKVLVNQMADIVVTQDDMAKNLESAIERAFEKAITNLIDKTQKRAAEQTGLWLWGTLKSLLSKWLVIGMLILSVGKYLGWQIAVELFDAIRGKGK